MQENETPKVANPSPSNAAWAEALWLPCQVSFVVWIPRFTVSDLVRLRMQSVVDSHRAESTEIEVELNGRLIGWAELESAGERLAFRLTELA